MRITNNIILHNTTGNINGNKGECQQSEQSDDIPEKDSETFRESGHCSALLKTAHNTQRDRSVLREQYPGCRILDESDRDGACQYEEDSDGHPYTVYLWSVRSDYRRRPQDDLDPVREARDQVYAEGNADYAGRTVFTGYRTNQKLTFMDRRQYDILQYHTGLSYKNLEEHRYYSDEVTLPTTAAEVTGNTISNPKQATFDRIRLSYGEIDSITDKDGNALSANGATGTLSYSYTDAAGVTQTDGELKVTVYDTFEDWAKASQTADNTYNITDGEAVFIKESGELILSSDASSTIKSGRASLDVNYTKTGFNKGEVRPEYYYNCTNITDAAKPVEYIKFENGKEIYQDINYVVAANQTLTVNTQASAVFDASIGRDVDAMIEAVKFAQDANNKVEELEKMQKMQEYSSDDCQAALEDWIAAAKKERDYADDNLQKLYNSYIGNFDDYLQKVNLANTDLGSKGQSLDLTKNRMANQQTTMEELKSTNEDRDLSEIIIDYTSAYTAYQASLQAAAKINQTTLLNYI